MSSGKLLRPLVQEDVVEVVGIHLAAFPGFFLSFLGPAFLRELYEGIVADPAGLHFLCAVAGRPVGFVAGTTQPAGLYRRLLQQRAWRFARASLGAVVRQPAIVPRLLRALRRPAEAASAPEPYALLMSVAVRPEAQGHGLGQALVQTFLDAADQHGLSRVVLTTDRNNNDAVNHFYQRLGFAPVRAFVTAEGRAMNELECRLPRPKVSHAL